MIGGGLFVHSFIDDIACPTADDNQKNGNYKIMKSMLKSKNLEMNTDKCVLIFYDHNDHIVEDDYGEVLATESSEKYLDQK